MLKIKSTWRRARAGMRIVRKEYLVEQYLRAGAKFGDALSAGYTGKVSKLQALRKRWTEFERAYAALGFRTITLADFIEYGGFGKTVDDLLRVTRAHGEPPVYHAEVFARAYPHGVASGTVYEQILKDAQPH